MVRARLVGGYGYTVSPVACVLGAEGSTWPRLPSPAVARSMLAHTHHCHARGGHR